MQIVLTWDLFIIVFFTIIVSYSFIIGKSHTVKLVLSSYISILSADAIGNIINTFLTSTNPIIQVFSFNGHTPALIVVKIALFIIFMITFSLKGSFEINMERSEGILEFFITLFFGMLSATLIISAILVFSSGSSFIMGGIPITESNIANMYNQSYLVKAMILNYNLWFALPVIAFLVMSLSRINEE